MRHAIPRTAGLVAAAALVTSLAACSGGGTGDDGTVEIEFFQSKTESVDIVNTLIEEFEKDHPGITVTQNNSPDALTALKADLAKGNVPDVIAINVSNYNDVAQADILTDQSGTDAFDAVANQGAIDYANQAGQTGDTTNALPWTVNAQVVLYDKDQFEQLGLSVPTTWDEFIDTAEAIQDAGEAPFTFTWKDAWTAKLVLNSLAGPTQGDDFWTQLQDGDATFSDSDAYHTAAQRLLDLKDLAQDDPFGTSYDDGNAAFANGDSVMYVQGTWAIPEITKVNADKNIGAFVLPTGDSASDTLLTSGPDSVVGVAKDGDHVEEAQEFVDFLFSATAQQEYADDQHLLSVRDDVTPADETLVDLKSQYLDAGLTDMYPDGMFTGASDLAALTQSFLYDGDIDAFLESVDADFEQNGIK